MIFVTVGTHEQQFNRLIEYMDKWAIENDEEVIIQTGYSTYEPKNCKWQKLFSFQEMCKYVDDARIVIVSRRYKFNEHVNDHQVNFCREVENRMGTIIVVEEIEKLGEILKKYDEIISGLGNAIKSNNTLFCKKLDAIVDEMFGEENK